MKSRIFYVLYKFEEEGNFVGRGAGKPLRAYVYDMRGVSTWREKGKESRENDAHTRNGGA